MLISGTNSCVSDSSSLGLGAVQLQDFEGTLYPAAYASRSLTYTERKYPQLEKAFAVTWACEKFRAYITGLQVIVQTDHNHW